MPNINQLISSQSTVTLQQLVDTAQGFGDLEPILNVSTPYAQPALNAANDTMNAICAVPFPWKWNEFQLPVFYTNSYQQDYAILNQGSSYTNNIAWLERGIVVDINNTANPKPYRQVEVGRQLPQATGSFWNSATNSPLFRCNWFPNYMLYYGVWGVGNVSSSNQVNGFGLLGNNPTSGSVYTNPLGAPSQPISPINQIYDANGNYLILTGYGTEGTTAPVAPANSAAGTIATPGSGATTQWTVLDPLGYGVRIDPVPSQTGVVWQFNLVGQLKPIRFTSYQQTLAPLPDDMEPHFRQGWTAQLYRYSPEAKIRMKFKEEWPLWLKSLNDMRVKEDRELEENRFIIRRGVMGQGQQRSGRWAGAGWPYNGPPGY